MNEETTVQAFCDWLLGFFLPLSKYTSKPKPTNTNTTPTHCLNKRLLPNRTTDPRIVKNFLVVVIMEHVKGPNVVTVVKINICPMALAILKSSKLRITKGCLDKKPIANRPSPEITKPV